MKTAYVSLTYLFQFEPKELGLTDDCTEEEFEAAIDGQLSEVFDEVYETIGCPNDIEKEFRGF